MVLSVNTSMKKCRTPTISCNSLGYELDRVEQSRCYMPRFCSSVFVLHLLSIANMALPFIHSFANRIYRTYLAHIVFDWNSEKAEYFRRYILCACRSTRHRTLSPTPQHGWPVVSWCQQTWSGYVEEQRTVANLFELNGVSVLRIDSVCTYAETPVEVACSTRMPVRLAKMSALACWYRLSRIALLKGLPRPFDLPLWLVDGPQWDLLSWYQAKSG